MGKISTPDGVNLYVEAVGSGTPVIFVHEYAGDYRSWEPQVRYFCRQHRCVTYSQRGYPPSDVPSDPARYSQDLARDDVIAVMDALGIDKAHVVGHSMGGYTALHVGIRYPQRCLSVTAAGCGWGSAPDAERRAAMKALAAETSRHERSTSPVRQPALETVAPAVALLHQRQSVDFAALTIMAPGSAPPQIMKEHVLST